MKKQKAQPKKKSVKKTKRSHHKMMLKSLVKPDKPPLKIMNFKVSPIEKKEIEKVAERYCKGNVTALVKIAVRAFKPSKRDLVAIR